METYLISLLHKGDITPHNSSELDNMNKEHLYRPLSTGEKKKLYSTSLKNKKTKHRTGQNSADYVIMYNLAKPTRHFRTCPCGYTHSVIIVMSQRD